MRARRLIRSRHKCDAICYLSAQRKSIVWGLIVWALCSVEGPCNAHAYLVPESDKVQGIREKDGNETTVSNNESDVPEPARKFVVPGERADEVWEFLCSYFSLNSEAVKSIDP